MKGLVFLLTKARWARIHLHLAKLANEHKLQRVELSDCSPCLSFEGGNRKSLFVHQLFEVV
jgi:hypothetical protein